MPPSRERKKLNLPKPKPLDLEAFIDRVFPVLPEVAGSKTARVTGKTNRSKTGRPSEVDRAASYLETCDPSIAGQNGHTKLFNAARRLAGFNLDEETNVQLLLNHFNPRCMPPWSEKEIRHKVSEGIKKADEGGTTGGLVEAENYESFTERGRLPIGFDGPIDRPTFADEINRPVGSAPAPPFTAHQDGEKGDRSSDRPPARQPVKPAAGGPPVQPPTDTDSTPIPFGLEDNPHRLANLFLDGYRHADGPTIRYWRGEFHVWDGVAYRTIDEGVIKCRLSNFLENEFAGIYEGQSIAHAISSKSGDGPPKSPKLIPVTTSIRTNVIEAFKGLILIENSAVSDQPEWLWEDDVNIEAAWPADEVLPMRNGLIHVPSAADRSMGPISPTPAFFCGFAVGYDYAPDAPSPHAWHRFLRSVWPNDQQSIDTLQEWMGYLLTPDNRHQKIMMIIGKPRSGKGTIEDVIKELIGYENVVCPTLGDFEDKFGLENFPGKSAAIIPDARMSGKMDSVAIVERLLSVSGSNGPQQIRRKHLKAIQSRIRCRFTIMSNLAPKLKDASAAIISRLVVLSMPISYLNREDKDLPKKLSAEMPGILNWAIEGWERLRKRNCFVQPESAYTVIRELREMASPVDAFVADRCVADPDATTSRLTMFHAYQLWCENQNVTCSLTDKTFGKEFRKHAINLKPDVRPWIDGGRTWCYSGVGLNDNVEEIDDSDGPEHEVLDLY
jgi:putative DNA primase/helicase